MAAPAPATSDETESAGASSLQMATANVNTQLSSIDSLDSKAMFIFAIAAAIMSAFAAYAAATDMPHTALIAPLVVTLGAVSLCLVSLWPRDFAQFPAAKDLLCYRSKGYTDDALAWAYVESLQQASEALEKPIKMKAWLVYSALATTGLLATIVIVEATLLAPRPSGVPI